MWAILPKIYQKINQFENEEKSLSITFYSISLFYSLFLFSENTACK